MAKGKRWTKHELLIALNVYHKLRFGQFHARQPVIIDTAKRLERTPGSLAMKLSNFASLDPALQLRGIRGLEGASNLDRSAWIEFHENPLDMVPASEEALRSIFHTADDKQLEVNPDKGVRFRKKSLPEVTEATATVKQRRGQDYFRDAVLNNFGGRCGITGLDIRELLIASHILPWSKYPGERLNVRNGISLSRLHDAAFDIGLIAFDDNLQLILSHRLRKRISHEAIKSNFCEYAGIALKLPDDAQLPEAQFLSAHRKTFGF